MTATLASITGTVTIALDGHETSAVGTFEVPVTATLDKASGEATLTTAPPDAILAAAADALAVASRMLLASIPTAEVTYEDGTLVDSSSARTIRCADCGVEMSILGGGATLEHAEGGAHVFSPTYGD